MTVHIAFLFNYEEGYTQSLVRYTKVHKGKELMFGETLSQIEKAGKPTASLQTSFSRLRQGHLHIRVGMAHQLGQTLHVL